jgi:lipoate-protein ligase A
LLHATTAEAILGYQLDLTVVMRAFVDGFQSALNISFVQSDLTEQEKSEVERLTIEKYAHPAWLERL